MYPPTFHFPSHSHNSLRSKVADNGTKKITSIETQNLQGNKTQVSH